MMNDNKSKVALAGEMHDIGKVCQRAHAGERGGTHSRMGRDELVKILPDNKYTDLLEAVLYHHADSLKGARLPEDHIAYIVYEADNISSGTDRRNRPEEGQETEYKGLFDSSKCLESVYGLVRTQRRNEDTQEYIQLSDIKDTEKSVIFPEKTLIRATPGQYLEIWNDYLRGLIAVDWEKPDNCVNSVHALGESYFSRVPASTNTKEACDVSLFDHSSLTSAIALCILDWLEESNISNYKKLLLEDSASFRNKDVFLLVRADLSGIQDFIYSIASKKALRALKGRSVYLELLLEHVADEILEELELSRSNLIYSGGGGFYMLLPNTRRTVDVLENASEKINTFLFEAYSTRIFFAMGWAPAKAQDLMLLEDSQGYGMKSVFREASYQTSLQKMQRYNKLNLESMFEPEEPKDRDRECSVCGASDKLKDFDSMDDSQICVHCNDLIHLGKNLVKLSRKGSRNKENAIFCIETNNTDQNDNNHLCVELPSLQGRAWLTTRTEKFVNNEDFIKNSEVKRFYSVSHMATGRNFSAKISVDNYCFASGVNDNKPIEFSDFIRKESDGIERLAVMRADVDSLGNLFVRGLRDGDPLGYKYETLSRYATLSRSLSFFFKQGINHIASDKERNMIIVYSGGDDVFAIGKWQDILEFAVDLREAFRLFTSDKLSFSAGIGFFHVKFPVSQMADIVAELESAAKTKDPVKKDQIALFGVTEREGKRQCRHVYDWDIFQKEVLAKKAFLLEHINFQFGTSEDIGKAFLYKIYNLLLEGDLAGASSTSTAHEDKKALSLARMAYLLGRHEPSDRSSKKWSEYAIFKKNIYQWATDTEHRRQLITAIMLSVYEKREKKGV